MSQEEVLRAALLVIAAMLYVNHHILHRAPSSGRKAKPLRGLELLLVIAACAWTAGLVLFVFGVNAGAYELPLWARWVGVLVMVACFPLSSWIYRTLGVHFSKKLELRGDHELVRSGPYRYVRHPMYATLFLCAAGTCLVTAQAAVLCATIAIAAVFYFRIQQEEHMLLGRFGDQYLEYRQKTAALVPGLL